MLAISPWDTSVGDLRQIILELNEPYIRQPGDPSPMRLETEEAAEESSASFWVEESDGDLTSRAKRVNFSVVEGRDSISSRYNEGELYEVVIMGAI